MPRYEVYVEETHYYREEIEADSPEEAEEKFWGLQLFSEVHAYDVEVMYSHSLPVEG